MTAEDFSAKDTAALQAMLEEHRRIIEELEARLSPDTPIGTQPGKPLRLARGSVRRAARIAAQRGEETIWLAQPPEGEGQNHWADELRALAGARIHTWHRSHDARVAIQDGNLVAAREALRDVLTTEEAIQAVIDGIELPPAWRSLGADLAAASDTVIEGVREELSALEHQPEGHGSIASAMAKMITGQSNWRRAWPAFLMVAPAL